MDIGKLINKRRTELELTLEDVGNAVGVSKSTVKKWEDGFISNMKRDKIAELAKVLKTQILFHLSQVKKLLRIRLIAFSMTLTISDHLHLKSFLWLVR